MFEEQDPAILSYVPDYRINLIAPEAIADEDFDKFVSSLQEALSFIKYSKDADKLNELLESNEAFKHLGRDEVDVLNACTNAEITMSESEEVIDVCQAIQVLNQRAASKERTATLTENIRNLMASTGWTLEQAMYKLKISEEDRKIILSEL